MMFKDIHCHILPGIDDGSRSIEESIEILRRAEKEGVSEIVLTPHYIENSRYNCNNKNKNELYLLKNRIQYTLSSNRINELKT